MADEDDGADWATRDANGLGVRAANLGDWRGQFGKFRGESPARIEEEEEEWEWEWEWR